MINIAEAPTEGGVSRYGGVRGGGMMMMERRLQSESS